MLKTAFRIKTTKQGILLSAMLLALVGVVILALFFFKSTNTYEVKTEMYQYFAGEKFTYQNDVNFVYENGKIYNQTGGNKSELSSTPFFFTAENKLLLPKTVEYISHSTEQLGRLDYFTVISKTENKITLDRNGKKLEVDGGFIYDGKELYIFLSPCTITYGDKEIEVSALSYAQVQYNSQINIFDYEKQQQITDLLSGEDVIAKTKEGNSIEMNTGVLISKNGEESLLVTTPELLNPLV